MERVGQPIVWYSYSLDLSAEAYAYPELAELVHQRTEELMRATYPIGDNEVTLLMVQHYRVVETGELIEVDGDMVPNLRRETCSAEEAEMVSLFFEAQGVA